MVFGKLLNRFFPGFLDFKNADEFGDDKNVLDSLAHRAKFDCPLALGVHGVNGNQRADPETVHVIHVRQIDDELPVALLEQIHGACSEFGCLVPAQERSLEFENRDIQVFQCHGLDSHEILLKTDLFDEPYPLRL
jgi:hypothetical protein